MTNRVDLLFYGLWILVLIIALIVQAIPIFFLVVICSLAVGFSIEAALTVAPIAFIAMLYLSCLIASKLTRRPTAGSEAGRSGPGVQTQSRFALPANTASPADYYRDVKRLG